VLPLALLLSLLLAAAPHVAVLSTSKGVTELRFQPLGDAALAPVAASFSHEAGSTVRAGSVPGRPVVLAVAALEHHPDASFGASLVRLEAGQPPRVLTTGLALASAPAISAGGRVFVQRGRAGPVLLPGLFRVDALRIDEVNPETGALSLLYASEGSFAYVAGFFGNELLVYEAGAAGARLLGIELDSRVVRVLRASLPPLAHDFAVDEAGKRLLYTLGAPGSDGWSVVETRLDVPASRVLGTGDRVALLPTVLPDGRVLISAGPGRGLVDLATGEVVLPAQGEGFERVRFFWQGLAIGLHETPSSFPVPFVLSLPTAARLAQTSRLAAVPDARLELAGVGP